MLGSRIRTLPTSWPAVASQMGTAVLRSNSASVRRPITEPPTRESNRSANRDRTPGAQAADAYYRFGGYVTDTAVGRDLVVFLPPLFDAEAGFSQGGEPVLVQAFVAELAVEAFDVTATFSKKKSLLKHYDVHEPGGPPVLDDVHESAPRFGVDCTPLRDGGRRHSLAGDQLCIIM